MRPISIRDPGILPPARLSAARRPRAAFHSTSNLSKTIKRGIDTTGMPAWSPLTDQQRADFVAYIKSFSPRFKEEKPDAPVVIPPETPNTSDSVKRGEVLYQETLKCVQCHGATGLGDGPSAATLRDNKDNPIVPYNFVERTRFKCGNTSVDL